MSSCRLSVLLAAIEQEARARLNEGLPLEGRPLEGRPLDDDGLLDLISQLLPCQGFRDRLRARLAGGCLCKEIGLPSFFFSVELESGVGQSAVTPPFVLDPARRYSLGLACLHLSNPTIRITPQTQTLAYTLNGEDHVIRLAEQEYRPSELIAEVHRRLGLSGHTGPQASPYLRLYILMNGHPKIVVNDPKVFQIRWEDSTLFRALGVKRRDYGHLRSSEWIGRRALTWAWAAHKLEVEAHFTTPPLTYYFTVPSVYKSSYLFECPQPEYWAIRAERGGGVVRCLEVGISDSLVSIPDTARLHRLDLKAKACFHVLPV